MGKKPLILNENNFFRNILNATSEGIMVIDKTRHIIYQNRILDHLFGSKVGKLCYHSYFGFDNP